MFLLYVFALNAQGLAIFTTNVDAENCYGRNLLISGFWWLNLMGLNRCWQ
jgi:hypothetical protein